MRMEPVASPSHQGLLETWLLVSPMGPGMGKEGPPTLGDNHPRLSPGPPK